MYQHVDEVERGDMRPPRGRRDGLIDELDVRPLIILVTTGGDWAVPPRPCTVPSQAPPSANEDHVARLLRCESDRPPPLLVDLAMHLLKTIVQRAPGRVVEAKLQHSRASELCTQELHHLRQTVDGLRHHRHTLQHSVARVVRNVHGASN